MAWIMKPFGGLCPTIRQSFVIFAIMVLFNLSVSSYEDRENSADVESILLSQRNRDGKRQKESLKEFDNKVLLEKDRSVTSDFEAIDQISNPDELKRKRKFRRSEKVRSSKNLKTSSKEMKQNDTQKILFKEINHADMPLILNELLPEQYIVSTEVNHRVQRSKVQESGHVRRRHAKNRKRRSPAWLMNTYMLLCETGLDPNCQNLVNSTHTAHEY